MPATAYCSLSRSPPGHGPGRTVLFNLFVTFVHLLHAFCTMYIFNVAGPIKFS